MFQRDMETEESRFTQIIVFYMYLSLNVLISLSVWSYVHQKHIPTHNVYDSEIVLDSVSA